MKRKLPPDGDLCLVRNKVSNHLKSVVAESNVSSESESVQNRPAPTPLKSSFERNTDLGTIMNVLKDSEVFESMKFVFTEAELLVILCDDVDSFWNKMLLECRKNVDNCLADSES